MISVIPVLNAGNGLKGQPYPIPDFRYFRKLATECNPIASFFMYLCSRKQKGYETIGTEDR